MVVVLEVFYCMFGYLVKNSWRHLHSQMKKTQVFGTYLIVECVELFVSSEQSWAAGPYVY